MTDPKNCGACGHNCGTLPNVKPGATAPAVQCVAGACVIQPSGCVNGFGHCSTKPDDGCETNLTLPATCGGCTTKCTAPTALCSTAGSVPMCSSSCVAPNPDLCGASCVNKATDPANCGTCSRDCAMLPHLKTNPGVQCSGSGCVVPQSACATGFANCVTSANDTDGCETNTTSDAKNCGACARDCSALPHLKASPTVSCTGSGCVIASGSCATGFANCSTGTNDTDGCETPTNTLTNCGGCGTPCSVQNGTASCSTGTCTLASCNNGFYNCNGACIANSATCGGTCGAPGFTLCGTTCIASTDCCAPAASALHFVDPVNGTDDAQHGGAYGSCAYKTITYALTRSTGQIALQTATYSPSATEAFPIILTGSQQLLCNMNNSGRATLAGVGMDFTAGFQTAVSIRGGQNVVKDCIINGLANSSVCVAVFTSASAAAPHSLNHLDLGNCNSALVLVQDSVGNVVVQNSVLHGSNLGMVWKPFSSGQISSNSFTTGIVSADISCADGAPGVTGSGNTDTAGPGGKPTCLTCGACPF